MTAALRPSIPSVHPRVTKLCSDCDRPYTLAPHHAKQSKRCPECQQAYRVSYQHSREQERSYTRPAYEIKVGGPWVIECDPDHSWTARTSLTWSAIHLLAAVGSLAEGTAFRHANGRRLVVAMAKGKLVARETR